MTVAEAVDRYIARYHLSGRRGVFTVEYRVRKHVKPFFGWRAVTELTEDDLVDYWSLRAKVGAKNSTIRAELCALRRALKLARVAPPPIPEDLTPSPPRVGFLEVADFERVAALLPRPLQPPFRFAYVTGWRLQSEVVTLLKTDVDLTGGWVQLRDSKNRDPRRFPLDCFGLRALCLSSLEKPPLESPYLFHRYGGHPIKHYRWAWKTACTRAGLSVLPHDFRRSAVRNLTNAGVDQTTAMKLTGHRTADIFRRYRIVNEGDLLRAADALTRHLSR